MKKLTVLTAPIGVHSSAYGGHHAVTRSLIAGLKQCNVPFNYNPKSLDQVGDVVHILGGDAVILDQALALKQRGIVKKILAGPNIFALYKPGNRYAQNKSIDVRITPCNWVRDAHLLRYNDLIEADFLAWPAGIDEERFMPTHQHDKQSNKVLVYNKQQNALTSQVQQLLKKYHFEPIVISYGSYKIDEFKKALSNVAFAVFLSKTESQGLALAECWAMNVPTLCWNLECPHQYNGIHYPTSSACPYLTDYTGFAFKTLDALEGLIKKGKSLFGGCTPRAWVLEHMTDKVCAQQLLDVVAALAD